MTKTILNCTYLNKLAMSDYFIPMLYPFVFPGGNNKDASHAREILHTV
jgi:hypothetical protein